MSAERNDGKKLEDLVTLIEGMGLQPGFKIEKNQPVYDEEGNQIAELDIIISGKLGTGKFRSLIECRDRPSDGSAPRSWIQQLIGRRIDLDVDKVMAVSSTGFAPGAVECARENNIELRTLQAVDADAVATCFPSTAPLIRQQWHICSTYIALSNPNVLDGDQPRPIQFTMHDTCVIEKASDKRLSLFSMLGPVLNAGSFFDGIEFNGARQRQKVVVDESDRNAYFVEREGLRCEIEYLECEVEFWIEGSPMPLASVQEYKNAAGDVYAKVAHWKGDPNDVVREITVILGKHDPS